MTVVKENIMLPLISIEQAAIRQISKPNIRQEISKHTLADFSSSIRKLSHNTTIPQLRDVFQRKAQSLDALLRWLNFVFAQCGDVPEDQSLFPSLLYMAIYQALSRAEDAAGEAGPENGDDGGGLAGLFDHIMEKLRKCGTQCTNIVAEFRQLEKSAATIGKDDKVIDCILHAYQVQLDLVVAFINAALHRDHIDPAAERRVLVCEKAWGECVEDAQQFLRSHRFLDQEEQAVQQGQPAQHAGQRDSMQSPARQLSLTQLSLASSTSSARRKSGVYMLPRKRPFFFGRERELQLIRETLATQGSLAICGMRGVGKTSVAFNYALQARLDYDIIFWMHAEQTTTMIDSCHKALRLLDVVSASDRPGPETGGLWIDSLNEQTAKHKRVLVVFDNVESSDVLEAFLPDTYSDEDSGCFNVIVTTLRESIAEQLDAKVDIAPFTSDEGRDCVLSLATRTAVTRGSAPPTSSSRDVDSSAAQALGDELGGLPIGIVHMVALLRARHVSISTFLNEYRHHKAQYHKRPATAVAGIYNGSKPMISTNWTMTFGYLTDNSKPFLAVLSYLSPDAIPQELFGRWQSNGDLDLQLCATSVDDLPCCETFGQFLDVHEELLDLRLIDKDPKSGMLSLHRLEQIEFRQYLDRTSRIKAFQVAARLLYNAFPKHHVGQRFTGQWEECSMYIQHAVVLNEHYLEENDAAYPAPPEFAKLMGWCCWYMFEVADFTAFQRLHRGGMKAYDQLPVAAVDQNALAMLHYNAGTVETAMGLFAKADVSLNQALAVRRRLGNDDDIAATLNNLGLLYGSTHEFDRAKTCYREAERIHLARLPSADRDLSLNMVRHNLQRTALQRAAVQGVRGPGAVRLPSIAELQATVAFFKSTISWWIAGHACLVLGNALLQQGLYDQARAAYTDAYNTLAAPGKAAKQPAVAMVLYKLGYVDYLQKRYTNAAIKFRASIAISELYSAIPGEQARTQFLLAQVLRAGATPQSADELVTTEKTVVRLVEAYHAANGRSVFEYSVPTQLEGFTALITSKYQ